MEGVLQMTREQARKIVDRIITDLSDRRGLRHEWDQIDDDTREGLKKVLSEFKERYAASAAAPR